MTTISNKDAAMVFRQGADSIAEMKKKIDILQAKSDVIDVFAMALSGKRQTEQGYAVCIEWKLRDAANAIEAEDTTE